MNIPPNLPNPNSYSSGYTASSEASAVEASVASQGNNQLDSNQLGSNQLENEHETSNHQALAQPESQQFESQQGEVTSINSTDSLPALETDDGSVGLAPGRSFSPIAGIRSAIRSELQSLMRESLSDSFDSGGPSGNILYRFSNSFQESSFQGPRFRGNMNNMPIWRDFRAINIMSPDASARQAFSDFVEEGRGVCPISARRPSDCAFKDEWVSYETRSVNNDGTTRAVRRFLEKPSYDELLLSRRPHCPTTHQLITQGSRVMLHHVGDTAEFVVISPISYYPRAEGSRELDLAIYKRNARMEGTSLEPKEWMSYEIQGATLFLTVDAFNDKFLGDSSPEEYRCPLTYAPVKASVVDSFRHHPVLNISSDEEIEIID